MKCFKYTNRPKSYITVKMIHEPHGEGTDTVVSVGCTLKGDMQNPTWKVHVPLDLAESVGQELMRLARISREDKTKSGLSTRTVSLISRNEIATKQDLQITPPTPEEMKVHADRAVDQGRVIKRAKREL